MNILARVHLYPPEHCAGAERMLQAMLEALVERGHHVTVSLAKPTRGKYPYMLNGVLVLPLDYKLNEVHGAGPRMAIRPWRAWADDADVVITHLDQTSEVVGYCAITDKPVVQILHNTHAPTRMWATCRADLLVYNSEWMADELGRDPRGIIVRPPVFADQFRGDRRRFADPGGYVTLVNCNQAKGGIIFAQLAAMMPDVEFLAVDGAYGEQLHPSMPNFLHLPHGRVDMRDVYRATSVLVMPSEYESWGRTAIEACAAGIPVIASPTPGLRESLDYAGTFVPRDSLPLWEHHIRRFLTDPDAYAAASSIALARAAQLNPTDDLARWCDAVEAL